MRDVELHNRIMRRIRCVYLMNRYCSATLCKMYSLVAMGTLLAAMVSVPSIYANMGHTLDPMYVTDYLMRAFLHTEFVVQVLSVVLVALMAWLVVDALRRLSGVMFQLRGARS